jgi:hypothetical protein
MAHSTAVPAAASALEPETEAREPLYKADHPRAIDRHIDFFGDGALSAVACDRCGDLFLESLA